MAKELNYPQKIVREMMAPTFKLDDDSQDYHCLFKYTYCQEARFVRTMPSIAMDSVRFLEIDVRWMQSVELFKNLISVTILDYQKQSIETINVPLVILPNCSDASIFAEGSICASTVWLKNTVISKEQQI